MLSIIWYYMASESTIHVLGCAAALWQLEIFYVKCSVLGSQYNLQFPGCNAFLKTHYPSLTHPHQVWRVPSILSHAPRRREFLADDTYLWGLLLAEIKSRANLAIIGMNHKTSLPWAPFWLQAMTSWSYVHWTDATHVPIFQVVGNVGSILIFLFLQEVLTPQMCNTERFTQRVCCLIF